MRDGGKAFIACGVVLALVLAAPALAEDEIDVGRSAAGKIKARLDFQQPVVLDPSIFPGISGYAFAEPAFHSTILDDPSDDFFQFGPLGSFQFILISHDPGVEVWNDTGSGFLPVGGSYFIGVAPFDNHPVWNIPDILETGTQSLTLKLHDTAGIYADSDPITLSFRALPEPTSAVLVVAGCLGALRRRRV
jgi:hypothetical protein